MPDGAPCRPALQELGPGQGDDEDRVAAGMLDQLLDEVEKP